MSMTIMDPRPGQEANCPTSGGGACTLPPTIKGLLRIAARIGPNEALPPIVKTPSTADPSEAKIRSIMQRIADNHIRVAMRENQLPDLRPGQAIVERSGGKGGFPNATVIYGVESVDPVKEEITLRSFRSSYSSDPRITMKFSELREKLNDSNTGWELREAASTDAKRVPARAEIFHQQVVKDMQRLERLRLEQELGPERFKIFNALMDRYQTLSSEHEQRVSELVAWRQQKGGFTSMKRTAYSIAKFGLFERGQNPHLNDPIVVPWALYEQRGPFIKSMTDPELFNPAPQRAAIATLEKAMAETLKAATQVRNKQPLKVSPGIDPGLSKIALLSSKDGAQRLSLAADFQINMDFFKQAVATDQVGDAWLAYHATVQPYLHLKTKEGESFHHTADDRASLTFAINQAIQIKVLGDRKLALTSADLIRMRPEIEKNWGRIRNLQDHLDGHPPMPLDWNPAFDQAAAEMLDTEIARLKKIEQSVAHRHVSSIISPEKINPLVDQIIAKEPSWTQRFGNGVLDILDSPETWAMVAVGAATMGTASSAVLGRSAIGFGRLVTLCRQGALTSRALGLFATSTAVDSAAFHTGMNWFNIVREKEELADWGPGAYARSFLMTLAVYGTNARHILRQMKMSPAIHRRILEQGLYFGEEATAMTAVGLGETWLREGDVEVAWQHLEHNAQFLLAMRIVHGARTLWPKKAEGKFKAAREEFIRDPDSGKLSEAFEAFKAYEKSLQEMLSKGQLAPEPPVLEGLTATARGEAVVDYLKQVLDSAVPITDKTLLNEIHGWARSAFKADNKGERWEAGDKQQVIELFTKLDSLISNTGGQDSAGEPLARTPANKGDIPKDGKIRKAHPELAGIEIPNLQSYSAAETAVVIGDFLGKVIETYNSGQLSRDQLMGVAEWVNQQRGLSAGAWPASRSSQIDELTTRLQDLIIGKDNRRKDFPFQIPAPHIRRSDLELEEKAHDGHSHGKGNYPNRTRNTDANHLLQLLTNNDRQMGRLSPYRVIFDPGHILEAIGPSGKSESTIETPTPHASEHQVSGPMIHTFPVAPPLSAQDSSAIGIHVNREGLPMAAYYAGVMPHTSLPWSGIMQRVDKDGKIVWKVPQAVIEGRDNTLERLPAFELTDQQVAKILGVQTIPDHLNELVIGVTAPCCHSMGPYNPTRDLLTTRDILGMPEEKSQRFIQGLTSGDPFEADGWKNYFYLLSAIDTMEKEAGVDVRVRVSGYGEITLGKEMVLGSINGRQTPGELFDSNAPQLEHVISFLKAPLLTGSSVLIHMDAGKAPTFNMADPIAVYKEIRDPSGLEGDRVTHDRYIIQHETDYSNMRALDHILTKLAPFAGGRGGKVIHAHLAGLGRFQRLGPDHFQRMRQLLEKHPHLYIDASWDQATGQLASNPTYVKEMARLIYDFPDRFIYGSDSVGQGDTITGTAHLNNLRLLESIGLLPELRELDKAHGTNLLDRFLRNNFDDVILRSALNTTIWRSHKDVQEWLDRRGFDPKEGERSQPMPVVYVQGTELYQEGFYYNRAYYKDLYGAEAENHIRKSQEWQRRRGERPFPVISDYSGM